METKVSSGDVKDISLAREGIKRIQWAAREMSVIGLIKERFSRERPLQGIRISGCLHITSETANLALAFKEAGAAVALCASNPLSTQDDVAAALVSEYGIPTFAIKGEDSQTFYQHINAALEHGPHVTLDDGADLVSILHTERQELIEGVKGGTEETTTGVTRLEAMAQKGVLRYPIVAVNEASTSISSTTATALARAPWMALLALPICSGREEKWSSSATVGAAGASPTEPVAWGLTSP